MYIKRVERNKRKFVTAVSGLEAFGLENKKVAKDLGKKFATGASVTKVASGGELGFRWLVVRMVGYRKGGWSEVY